MRRPEEGVPVGAISWGFLNLLSGILSAHERMGSVPLPVLVLEESKKQFRRCVPKSWISAGVTGNGITGLNAP